MKYETILYNSDSIWQAFGSTYGSVKLFWSPRYLCYLLGFLCKGDKCAIFAVDFKKKKSTLHAPPIKKFI